VRAKRIKLVFLIVLALAFSFSGRVWANSLCADTVLKTIPIDEKMRALPIDSVHPVVLPMDSVMESTKALQDSTITVYTDSLQRTVGDTLKINRFKDWKPDPIRAMWLGMVFPGGGQIYNRKYWKLPIVYGGVVACIYAVNWNAQMLRDYSQAYQDITDNDPTTNSYLEMLPLGYDITGREAHFKSVFKRKKDFYRRYRDLSIFFIAGVYVLSIVDAYVDAELSTFDISPDLSLSIEPQFISGGVYTSSNPFSATPAIAFKLNY
jgi:hypothetical protein